jgi:hypothetical protein
MKDNFIWYVTFPKLRVILDNSVGEMQWSRNFKFVLLMTNTFVARFIAFPDTQELPNIDDIRGQASKSGILYWLEFQCSS